MGKLIESKKTVSEALFLQTNFKMFFFRIQKIGYNAPCSRAVQKVPVEQSVT
jgi:hypothetical protein